MMVSTRRISRTKLDFQKNWPIESLPGLHPQDCQKLKEYGIETTLQLLQQTRKDSSKQNLAATMQVHLQHITKWAALADLSRVPSVGCQYCGLLLHVGICSVSQLTQVSSHSLQKRILRLQVATIQQPDGVHRNFGLIAQWIQEARQLT
jgi:hypothetical protein